jgi:hypothetical protein
MTEFHVAPAGDDAGPGSAERPFRSIGRAAELARPGDTVTVHAGVYREWVKPARGGTADQPITYRAADGDHVLITGAERVTDWTPEGGGVWRATLPAAVFGGFNPFAETIWGDWFIRPGEGEPPKHLGQVYLDGKALWEADSRDGVAQPGRRDRVRDDVTGLDRPLDDPDWTERTWYAEVRDGVTVIWANFGATDPTAACAEINVRPAVFYPAVHHADHITVRGFELAQAATPWTPPTADQIGLIGPNWAKGWTIEDCDIHDARCAAVSLGKEASTGDNWHSRRMDKPGHQYQVEAVFLALAAGWSKETIGSHTVRRNHIHDCGQAGVVGHLGCVFSEISDNHIHHIDARREFFGWEIAGIKLHAAIDVVIRDNLIHDCSLGTWLDWQAQGTHLTCNTYCNNSRDLFIEVSHGPYVVDGNVFASPASLDTMSQGGAYVGNLVCGAIRQAPVWDRHTPYHFPHSTAVAGFAHVQGGDDRWYGNIFCGAGGAARATDAAYSAEAIFTDPMAYGTLVYAGHPGSFAEYQDNVRAARRTGVDDLWAGVKQPVYLAGNVYLNGAEPAPAELGALVVGAPLPAPSVTLADGAWLDITLPPEFAGLPAAVQTTASLGRPRLVEARYEAADGSDLVVGPGRLGSLVAGPNHLRVWGLSS